MPGSASNAKKTRSSANPVRPELRPYLAIIIAVVLLDQLSKYLIHSYMVPGESIGIVGNLLRFSFVFNPGGAFGLRFGNYWFYMILSLAASIFVMVYFLKNIEQSWLAKCCLALVVGGAFGNFFDRLVHTQVIDFIDIDLPDIIIPPFSLGFIKFDGYALYRWYTFNIADAAVTAGLAGFIIHLIIKNKTADQSAGHDPITAPHHENADPETDRP
jgi:signal peptidase II